VWNYTDGWYRSLAFSADGQYLLCGGLKQNTAGGVQDVTAVYKVGEKQLKAAGVLTGHSKAVLLVLVTKNRAVTCSDDGCVNIYSLADMETDFHHPEKTVKVSENQLFDMVLMDETSLLTCSLDGNIYKVNINSGTATAVYTNIAGMYCTGCDFSRTINAKGEIL